MSGNKKFNIEEFRKTRTFKAIMFLKRVSLKFDFFIDIADNLIQKTFKYIGEIMSWIVLSPFILFKWLAFDLLFFLIERFYQKKQEKL